MFGSCSMQRGWMPFFLLMLAGCAAAHDVERGPDAEKVGVSVAALTPDTSCILRTFGGKQYYFCANTRSYAAAKAQCEGASFQLARIDSAAENAFIDQHIASDRWLGGSDSAAEGVWRWAIGGDQFWQGGASGSPVNGAYTNWTTGQPNDLGSEDCLQIQGNGKWLDDNCINTEQYICEEVDLCVDDPNKMSPGQCGCGAPDTDTDDDGSADCLDGCVNDPDKTTSGLCGCGIADDDSDEDGTPDCGDECPNDATKITAGDCGCANAPKPAGTACGDGVCAANNQCDGQGNCGTSSQCGPPDTTCSFGRFAGSAYWFCRNDRPFATARQKCQSKGMDLAVVQTEQEDDYITDQIIEHSFLAGSDQTVEGDWRWLPGAVPFWSGGPSGSAVNGAYTNWESSEPSTSLSTRDCLVKSSFGEGGWESHICSTGDAFVCELPDLCPFDPDKRQPGSCGCGVAERNIDGDSAPDCVDGCPWDPTRTTLGPDGCGPPCQGSVGSLFPTFECLLTNPDGSKSAVFGVNNTSACVVDVPVGSDNELQPAPAFRGQPTAFIPGTQRAVVRPITGNLTWKLGTRTAVATLSGPPCENVTQAEDEPVTLEPTFDHGSSTSTGGTVDNPVPIDFEIPERIRVAAGNGSNGTATLTFRNGAGPTVTCTYQGGSSVSEPVTDLDFARGLFLTFVACSNGLSPGDTATATHWETSMVGGDPRFGRTQLELTLGPGCGGVLDPPLTPEQTVLLRESFSWSATSAIPETTNEPGVSSPVPALRYALIYVESKEQVELLKQSRIYYRQLPIFASQLDRYRGKCGVVDNQGDLRGQFLHAILPASAYNRIRQDALNPGGGTGVPSPKVILQPIPDTVLANPDGTLSWKKMAEAGFLYFREDQPQPFFDDIIDAVGDFVEGAWEAGTELLGGVARFIKGTHIVRFELAVLNRDAGLTPFGTGRMARAWGPFNFIYPEGVDFELLRWDLDVLPTSYWGVLGGPGTIGEFGMVQIRAAEGGDSRGSGLCVHMENDAAEISHGVTENEFCDFDIPGLSGGLRRDFPADGGFHELRVTHREFNYLTQITDARRYMLAVVDEAPAKAEVAVGWAPNLIGLANDNRPFAACLDFAELKNSVATLLVGLGSALGQLPGTGIAVALTAAAEPFFAKDIFLPTPANSNRSRGVVTHEYGHFVMCDEFDEQDELFDLYSARVLGEGFAEDLDSETGMAMESFADLFASQVVSGVNYPNLPQDALSPPLVAGSTEAGSMSYCVAANCLEPNYRGLLDGHDPGMDTDDEDRYRDQVSRLVTTFHDAFDHNVSWRSEIMPTNADGWRGSNGLLSPRLFGDYQMNAEALDVVTLPGPALFDWLHRSVAYSPLNSGHAMQLALADVMYDEGYNWCQACELFVAHDPGMAATSAEMHVRWEACTMGELSDIVGPPPDPDLRLNGATCGLCSISQISDPSGTCVECDADLQRQRPVGNTCVACDPGFVVAPAGDVCLECDDFEITPPSGNSCEACPFPQKANRATNTCGECPPDVVIDTAPFEEDGLCSGVTPNITTNMAPGDLCPSDFWMEIQNIDTLAAGGPEASDLVLDVVAHSNLTGSACTESSISFGHDNFRTESSGEVPQTGATRTAPGVECHPGIPLCGAGFSCIYLFDNGIQTITADEIANTGLSNMRVHLDNFQGTIERIDFGPIALDLCFTPT